ncbi:MAG: MFS transporter [Chloroflexota bacterium]
MASSVAVPAEDRLLTADYVFATLANFANSFGSQMLTATLPVYVLVLGGDQADAGLISGMLAFTALLLRPPIGWLADIWRRRPLVLVGTAGYGAASIVYLLSGSVPMLMLGRVVHGFGLCNYTTAANAYLADIAPPRRRAEAIGFFSAAAGLGLILGPAIGFWIIDMAGFHEMFYFSAALAFSAFGISFFSRERRPPPPGPRPAWTPRTGIVALDALPIAWMSLCLGMGFGPVSAFVAIYAQSRGIGNPGLYFTVQALALLASRAFSGRLADRRGREFVVLPGIIAAAIAVGMLPWASDFWQFMLSAAIYGMGFGMAQPATMALLVDRVAPAQHGLAMSTYFTGFDLGISVSSIGLGIVGQTWGFGVAWPISAACTLLGLLGLLPGRRQAPKVST